MSKGVYGNVSEIMTHESKIEAQFSNQKSTTTSYDELFSWICTQEVLSRESFLVLLFQVNINSVKLTIISNYYINDSTRFPLHWCFIGYYN